LAVEKIGQTSPLTVIQSPTTWTNERTTGEFAHLNPTHWGRSGGTRTRRSRAQGESSNQIKNKESPEPKRNRAKQETPGVFGNLVFFVEVLVATQVRVSLTPDSLNYLLRRRASTQEQTSSPSMKADMGYYL